MPDNCLTCFRYSVQLVRLLIKHQIPSIIPAMPPLMGYNTKLSVSPYIFSVHCFNWTLILKDIPVSKNQLTKHSVDSMSKKNTDNILFKYPFLPDE